MESFDKNEALEGPDTIESRLRLVIDTIPCLILRAKPDGAFDFINQRWLEFTGLTLEEVQGWGWRAALHPEDAGRVVRDWRAALAEGEPFETEARIRRVDGAYRWFLLRNVPLRDELKRIVQWYGTGHDTEDLKQAKDRLMLAIDTTPALLHTGRPDGYLDYFNRRWLEYLGLSLDDICGWRWTRAIHPDDVEEMVKNWRLCLATGEPFEAEARVRRADGEYRWQFHRKVSLLGPSGAIVKWYGSSIDIEDRRRAEDGLRRSEFYLAEGQRIAHVGSWAFGPEGFDYWSPELFRMYGLDPGSKAPGVQEYLDCIHPQDRESMASLIELVLTEALAFDTTKRIVRPDGEVRYIRCVSAPIVDNQSLKKYIGSAIDVTEHVLLTQELQRREAYLAEAQRLSQTGSFGWRPDSGEIVWSDETYRIFEFDCTLKLTMDSLVRRVHPDDRPDFLKVIESASTGATQFEHTYRLLMPDGSVKHVHALAHASQDASGNREFVGAATDVTSIKRAEQELRKSEAYLAEAQRLSHTGSWAWNATTGEPGYWSEECYRVLGFDPAEPLPPLETFFQRIQPDDHRAAVREQFERAIRDKAELELDLSFVHPITGIRNLHSVSHAVLDQCGDLREIVGTVIDITESKRAEQTLRQSEAELRQLIDVIPQQVVVFDSDWGPLFANERELEYTGLTRQEAQSGDAIARIFHPEDLQKLEFLRKRALTDGSSFEMEARIKGNDGQFRWFLIRDNPLRDEDGRVVRWYGTRTDIEDRKRAEGSLQQALEEIKTLRDQLYKENIALREEIDKTSMFEEIVGASPALKAVLVKVAKVAPTDSTVLITGETGTGKELIARAIHKRSKRSARAFVSVNCAAVPRDLIASELFGHEKGAFTGATQRRLGRFELAEGGTIFLDEIGELPLETQIALLRVLQEREFERVGGNQPIRAEVRVIAATNRDLEAAIAASTFRSDLYYRLNVFPVEIPPLRERGDDIPLLVEYFIDRYARKAGKSIRRINKRSLELLQAYPWPGNIRELQNIVERSVIVCETENFSIDESWLSRRPHANSSGEPELTQKLAAKEKEMIETALKECGGRVFGPLGAAAKLGMPRSTLESRIRSLKIDKNRFKPAAV
ncbi:PAS domain S-box-containing protein [Edaphobacter aggregans]|uniref:PAS domain S-box-containing protein n=1 Tax=Edaphobacter aggregans TaxID=570835 RepID=A0A428MNJ6_9BACT|nr:sigma-54-dependent Fis family transcriptional regulator [Edaphobacter aggregans]RSL18416.1 PAS domain S-box-containing protein [Edaphobacter aggregans]